MTLLEKHTQLLKQIDSDYQALERLAAEGATDSVHVWRIHFKHVWESLLEQIDWMKPPTRRQALVRRLWPFHRQAGRIPRFESPIWKEERVGFPFPPERTTYSTFYGFQLVSCGLDSWQELATGHYASELAETLLILRLLPRLDVFVDVGANIGFYSLLAAVQSQGRLRVLSFEPSAENFDALERAIALNGVTTTVETHRKALGNQTGEADLYLCAGGTGGHSLQPPQRPGPWRERVPVDTLDRMGSAHALGGKKTLVKIDVEGTEYHVLQGAEAWLHAKQPPLLLFEAWPDSPQFRGHNNRVLVEKLHEAGYRVYAVERLEHGQPPLRFLPRGGSYRPAPIGNYLAFPTWASSWAEPLNARADLRVFTETRRLEALKGFLGRAKAALETQQRVAPFNRSRVP